MKDKTLLQELKEVILPRKESDEPDVKESNESNVPGSRFTATIVKVLPPTIDIIDIVDHANNGKEDEDYELFQ